MKLRIKLIKFFIIILTIINFSFVITKFSLTKKSLSNIKNKSEQLYGVSSSSGELGNSSNYGGPSRDAVTYGGAGESSKIPNNHPIITNLKKPRYVEQLKYYEDSPAREAETEAVSLNTSGDAYYRPFANKHLIYEAKSVYNCEALQSPYVCQESSLCQWDNNLRSCYYTRRVVHEIRFRQTNSKRKRNKKLLNQ